MSADAIKFLCKLFETLENKAYAELYGVDCTVEEDEIVLTTLLFLEQSTCSIDDSITCYLGKYGDSISTPVLFEDNSTDSCNVTPSDITTSSSCTSQPQLSVLS